MFLQNITTAAYGSMLRIVFANFYVYLNWVCVHICLKNARYVFVCLQKNDYIFRMWNTELNSIQFSYHTIYQERSPDISIQSKMSLWNNLGYHFKSSTTWFILLYLCAWNYFATHFLLLMTFVSSILQMVFSWIIFHLMSLKIKLMIRYFLSSRYIGQFQS